MAGAKHTLSRTLNRIRLVDPLSRFHEKLGSFAITNSWFSKTPELVPTVGEGDGDGDGDGGQGTGRGTLGGKESGRGSLLRAPAAG